MSTYHGRSKKRPVRQHPLQESGVLDAYCKLCVWRAKHIPWLSRPEGFHVFFRLVRRRQSAIYTSELYADAGAGASVPVVRETLMELERAGLVKISTDQGDARRHLIQPTAQLYQLAAAYVQAMMFFLG